jgi:cytochrome c oxidase subunit IV
MKVESWLFIAGTAFFALMSVIYAIFSHGEPIGTVAIAFTAGLAFLTGFYLYATGRRIGPRPEDRKDAEIEEGAGELGFFSPKSWWPLCLAGSAALLALGLVFGWWLVFIAAFAVAYSVIGMTFEYYRGEHVH